MLYPQNPTLALRVGRGKKNTRFPGTGRRAIAASDPIGEMIDDLKAKNVRYLRFELPDLHGTSRAKVVPIDNFESYALKGLNLYGGAIALDSSSGVVGGAGMNEEVNYRDHKFVPDPATIQVLPWAKGTAKVICDARWAAGEPIKASPRSVLANVLEQTAEMGSTC